MPGTLDTLACPADHDAGLLPVSPFYGVRYHFGMLLGVDDFETAQAYARGKMRLHNAWLHGAGVVWGLKVRFNDRKELQVDPGLAVDAAGHELHLDVPVCVDVGQWYDKHKDDKRLVVTPTADGVSFDAHVVVRFRACLTRQVPALAEPCVGAETDTAYSRAFETVDVLLVPGKAPSSPPPYHRLRLLFMLDDLLPAGGPPSAADQQVLTERAQIFALPPAQQPAAYLAAFRRFAALDEIDLGPAAIPDGQRGSLFPVVDDAPVVLADIAGIALAGTTGSWTVTPGTVNPSVRPSHVATSTIQELLCGPLFAAAGTPAPGPTPPPTDAGGPRVDPASVTRTGRRVVFTTTAPLHAASVDPRAFVVTSFGNEGWNTIEIRTATFSAAENTVTLDLREDPADNVARLIAYGTGPTPLLGTNLVPLAGTAGGPPGTLHDGHDFVAMLRRS